MNPVCRGPVPTVARRQTVETLAKTTPDTWFWKQTAPTAPSGWRFGSMKGESKKKECFSRVQCCQALLQQSQEVGTIAGPILQMRRRKPREAKGLPRVTQLVTARCSKPECPAWVCVILDKPFSLAPPWFPVPNMNTT